MVSAIGTGFAASAAMNTLLREISGAKTPGATRGSEKIGKTEPAAGLSGKSELTEEEKQQVEKLKQRDQEVRRHEAAHQAAAGGIAKGGASFEFTKGPDGKQYATGGEVQIDTSPVSGDPQATIRKMQQVQRAASAPAEPSSQDRGVAAKAAAAESEARAELASERRDKTESGSPSSSSPTSPSTSSTDSSGDSLKPQGVADGTSKTGVKASSPDDVAATRTITPAAASREATSSGRSPLADTFTVTASRRAIAQPRSSRARNTSIAASPPLAVGKFIDVSA